ncbi:MAG: hypothetical protein GQ569_13580 [Methylococcaceae bacterium]|nr:hypothetical protein [Methylococcaceae bacterium]
MDLIRLICISSATTIPTDRELKELLDGAKVRNKKRGVTGFLVYKNGTYLQVLEGERETVENLFNIISQDSRTAGIVKLKDESITQREFAHWHMGFKNLDGANKKDSPAYVDILDDGLDIKNINAIEGRALSLLLNFAKKEYISQ